MDTIFNKLIRKNLVSFIRYQNFSSKNNVKKIDKSIVESLERLALVDFPAETGAARLEQCVEYADKLKEVDTTDVEPLINTIYERNNNVREDLPAEVNNREELMKIAPETEEFYYVAPLGTFSRKQDDSGS